MDRAVAQVGFWSASLVTLLVATFGLLLLIGLWLPTTSLTFVVCLLLAPAFISMMVAVHYQASAGKRIWSHLGVAFAILYAVMVTITYFVQLSVVRLNSQPALPEVLRPFQYTPGTVFFAIDILGYSFMALSTLVAAPVFGGDRLSIGIRRWFRLQGLFLPGLIVPVLPIFSGATAGSGDKAGAWILIGWCVAFLPLSTLVATYFRRALRDGDRQAAV